MPRDKQPTIDLQAARRLGGVLRDLRRASGYRAVKDTASEPACPAAPQTIYAYERGGLVPSLGQFLDLVEFYGLATPGSSPVLRSMSVAAIHAALTSPVYEVTRAVELMGRLQPEPSLGRRRKTEARGA